MPPTAFDPKREADRRSHPRRTLNLPATFRWGNGPPHPCVIRNFSPGGLFIAVQDAQPRGSGEAVSVIFVEPASQRSYPMTGRLVWHSAQGYGVTFQGKADQALAVLEQLTGPPRREPARQADEAALAVARRAGQPLLASYVPDLATAFARAGEDALFQAAKGGQSDREQRLYLDAMQPFRRQGRGLAQRLLEGLAAGLEHLGRFQVGWDLSQAEQTYTELQLVDTGQFEDLLAVDEMVVRLRNRLEVPLRRVTGRLRSAAGEDFSDNENPLGISAFAHAFHAELAAGELDMAARPVLYQALEGLLQEHLGAFYRELDESLAGQGLEPPRPRRVEAPRPVVPAPATPTPEPAPPPQDETPPAATAPPAEAGHGATAGARDAYGAARRLLDLQRGVAGSPPSPAETPIADTATVVQALDQLQRTGSATPPGTVRDQLEDTLRLDGLPPVAGEQLEMVELMDRLVRGVRSDPRVSAALRERLPELSVPLHKAAFLAPEILSTDTHPVRLLLDQMGDLDATISVDGAPMSTHLDRVVARIRDGFTDDFGVFLEALGEVQGLARRQAEAYHGRVAEVVRASEEKARRVAGAGGGHRGDALERLPPGLAQYAPLLRRLTAGDALVRDEDDGDGPLRVAWVAPDHSSYVLVDRAGRARAELSAQELALQMTRGTTTLLPRDQPGVFEGALYGVLHRMHQEIRRQASHDPVTGLPTQAVFQQAVTDALARLRQAPSTAGAVLQVNLDHFHLINDTGGRDAGDRLLREVAGVFSDHGAPEQVAARVGGDEFALLWPEGDVAEARRRAETLRAQISGLQVEHGGIRVPVSASIGVVPLAGAGGIDALALERAAGAAVRAGKDEGGDRVVVLEVDEAVSGRRNEMIQWMTRLYQYIGSQTASLRVQRIVPLQRADDHVHYEVLLGFRDESGLLIPPQKLVEAAEFYDQSRNLDRWVLRATVGWLAGRQDLLETVGGFAVNLSGRSITDESLAEDIAGMLQDAGIPPHKLIFELTETAAVDNFTTAAHFIEDLRAVGCRFALDDFGAGHSGFNYLRQLPVDYVKIDGLFVRELITNPNDAAVVHSINEVAHFMGARTIAEYAEDDAILDRLRELGVDYAQGWGVEKPFFIEEWPGSGP